MLGKDGREHWNRNRREKEGRRGKEKDGKGKGKNGKREDLSGYVEERGTGGETRLTHSRPLPRPPR